MEIDELLVAIGVDTTQAAKIKDVVVALGVAATQIASEANKVNQTLGDVGHDSIKSTEEAKKKADEAGKSVNKLRLIAAGVGAAIGYVSSRVLGFIDSAISGAETLSKEKGLLFNISQQELKQASEYQEATKRTGLAIDSLKTKIALNLAPQITHATNGFNGWLKANKDLIANGLTKVIQVGGKSIQVVINSIKVIGMLIDKTIGWKAALILLIGVMAVLKRSMIAAFIANPVTWVVLAIVGLMLLLDDLMVYLKGGKSQFGDFWGACIAWIKKVKEWWSGLSDEFKTSLKLITAMFAVAFGSNLFMAVTTKAGLFGKVVGSLIKPIMSAGKAFIWLGRALLMNPIGFIIALVVGLGYALYDLYKWLKTGESAFGNFWKAIAETWEKIKKFFSDGVKSILMSLGMSEEGADKTVEAIGKVFGAVFDLLTYPFMQAWELIKGLFDIWGDDTTSFTDKIGKTFSLVTDLIKKPFKEAFDWAGNTFNGLIGGIKKGINSIKGFFGFGEDEATDISAIRQIADSIDVPPMNANAAISNRQNTINQGDTTITQNITTSDPLAAGRYAASGINQNRQAMKNSASVLQG